MQENFYQTLSNHNIQLDDRQIWQFEKYYALLVDWNAKMNLTAITEKDAVYSKHFLDSASLAFYFDVTKITTLCDVGSGAGFPSIVLKIIFPHLQITIVEALNKRLTFLQHLVETLALDGVTFVHQRAEDYGKQQREVFDLVTARAVARFKMLAELCVPLVKKEGYFIAMKGAHGETELQQAKPMLHQLGITKISAESFSLTCNETIEIRQIYICQKTLLTPKKYPRAFAQIKKDNEQK